MRVASAWPLVALAVFVGWHQPGIAQQAAAPAPGVKGPAALVEKSLSDIAHGKFGAAVKDDVTAIQRGPLLVHGNYCGVGNRPGMPPTDVLDEACMHHDACTVDGKVPNCQCDKRLYVEATAIAQNPQTPVTLQAMAGAVATSMSLLVCK